MFFVALVVGTLLPGTALALSAAQTELLRAHVLLERAHYAPGEIDARWQVRGVALRPVYRYNPQLFWDARAGEGQVLIAPGPNNPVGLAWIALSKPHYGIHGTPHPELIGKTPSHGCIRLSNWDVMAVAQAITKGSTVLLQE